MTPRVARPGAAAVAAPDLHPRIVGEHAPPVTDPALAEFSHFSFWIESDFNGGPGEGWNGYDRAAHRFYPSYINPRSYRLRLDAHVGLSRGQANVALARNIPDRPTRTSIEDFVDLTEGLVQAPGAGGAGGGGGGMVPDELDA